ncbi:MAG: T9SS type A sorting domain-containing protein [Chitinophagaceae bacterium]|nr:MAG: T9SS type A sorting domain-containing protein [Chitinophagaceae bacterium]
MINALSGTVVFQAPHGQPLTSSFFTNSTIFNLEARSGSNVTLQGSLTVSNNLILGSSPFYVGSNTLTLLGGLERIAGQLELSNATIIFAGTQTQNLPASSVIGYNEPGCGTISRLTVNNTVGVDLHSGQVISSALNLQKGYLNLNGNMLFLNAPVTGTGVFRGSAASGITVKNGQNIGTLNFDQTTDGNTNALSTMDLYWGTVTLGSKLNVYTGITMEWATLDLAGKNLVLKSNATKTAYLGEVKGTLTGETNVTVERFSPAWANRRYRVMTVPVTGISINQAWQEGVKWNGEGAPQSTGFGTLITGQSQGNATNANKNGFDFWTAIAGGSASVRYYAASANSTQANWQPVASTLAPNAFDEHQAYLLFIRGDRTVYAGTSPGASNLQASFQPVSSTLTTNAFDEHQAYLLFIRGDRSFYTGSNAGAATLRGNGKLKKGSFTIPVAAKQSHTLIGNPYAAPLDFKAVYDANNNKIQPYFWVWQASLGTGTGGYVLVRPVSPGSTLYEAIPGNGSKSSANRLIHSGEGFFVIAAKGASASNAITIHESHKTTTMPTVSVFRQMGAEEPAKVYVNMLTGGTENTLLDGIMAQYTDDGTDGGVGKAQNTTENLSILKNGSDVIITSNPLISAPDTLKLRMWNTVNRSYKLELRSENFSGTGSIPVLVDRFLNTETPLTDGAVPTVYPFTVTADAASRDQQRFYIAFKENKTLPLVITSITAEVKAAEQIVVKWRAADESGIQSYELERSFDGIVFHSLATIAARSGAGDQAYDFLDAEATSLNFYRVKMTGTNGKVKYSDVVKAMIQKPAESYTIYPNPVTGTTVNLRFQNKEKGEYTLLLYNMSGQVILSRTVQHAGGNATHILSLSEAVRPGNYKLEVKNEKGEKDYLNISVLK